MKKIIALLDAVALATAFTSSVLAQVLPPVLMTSSADPNFVVTTADHYAITEYYATNGGPAYTTNGLIFTDRPDHLSPGLPDGTFGAIYRNGATAFTGPDAAALVAISGDDVYCPQGINIENLTATPGHSYLVELLFHDNYYSSTNGVGKREFDVELAVQTNNYPDTVLIDHMDLAGMGVGVYNSVDVLARAITNGDYGTFSSAKNHHLVFGSEENPSNIYPPAQANNGYLTGSLYDVRLHNSALSSAQVSALLVPPGRPTVTATVVGSSVVLSWSADYPGYTVQRSSGITPVSWGPANLAVTLVNGQWTATDTLGAGPQYYRLVLQ